MVRQHILFINLVPDSCPSEEPKQIREIIGNIPLHKTIFLDVVNNILPPSLSYMPDLILLRPCSGKLLEETLNTLRDRWIEVPIIGLICSKWSALHELYSLLMNGLDDFLCCPFREIDLIPRIQRLLRDKIVFSSSSEIREMKEEFHLESLVGESPSFVQAIEKIPRLASSDATVLILGETGTGKELFARAIHYLSGRREKPFVPVNCGAMPDLLFENELFGHARGAFTDASTEQRGLLAEAEGGTLFLDEVDALSPSAQVKLLRFLQDKEYRPLGAGKSRVADVRIIAATNTDLRKQVESKRFRQDAYYRLNILSLSIPPLRERREDIAFLAAHFLEQEGRGRDRAPLRLSPGAVRKLMAYPWPGNIRELEGAIRRAALLASSFILDAEEIDLPSFGGKSDPLSLRKAKSQAIAQFERTYLIDLLATHQGNITRAATSAGKERRAFQRLLHKYSLDRHAFLKCVDSF